ncbi:MAG: M24 family metallopeptidase [Gaiellaceae bacterium]
MTAANALEDRFARVREGMAAASVDVVLVSPSADYRYLTGLVPPVPTRMTFLIVPVDGAIELVTPSLEAAGFETHTELQGLIAPVPWSDGDNPAAIAAARIRAHGTPKRIAVSDRTWARHLIPLEEQLAETQIVSGGGLLGSVRAVKDAGEIAALAEAARCISHVTAQLPEIAWAGRTERDVAADIAARMRDAGHEEVSFTILATGTNSANPHGMPTDRVILDGDVVQVDIGGKVNSYSSDISRVVSIGEPSDEVRQVYDVVSRAYEASLAAAQVGASGEAVDAAGRRVITDAGYGPNFLHRTGHGIGLDEHEEPFIIAGNVQPLVAGNVFSIEPGIYLPDRFGVRLENIVALEENGPRELSRDDHQIVVAG